MNKQVIECLYGTHQVGNANAWIVYVTFGFLLTRSLHSLYITITFASIDSTKPNTS